MNGIELQFLSLQRHILPIATELMSRCLDFHMDEARHFFERPGLSINTVNVGNEIHGMLVLKSEHLGRLLFQNISGYSIKKLVQIDHPDGMRYQYVKFQLDDTFDSQSEFLRKGYVSEFENAGIILAMALESIERNTPMDSSQSWEAVLTNVVQPYSEHEFNYEQYRLWISRWGTPDMKTSFLIADSLCDGSQNANAWKSTFLQTLALIKSTEAFNPSLSFDHGNAEQHDA